MSSAIGHDRPRNGNDRPRIGNRRDGNRHRPRSSPGAREAVLNVLCSTEDGLGPGEITSLTAFSARMVTTVLRGLRDDGLVDGPKTRPCLTARGRAVSRRSAALPGSTFDDAVEETFGPSPALAGFARIGADLIVARQLLEADDFCPSLLAYGPPGLGKTALAELFARALGLEPVEAIRDCSVLAPGELVGRRVQQPGGGYAFERASHLEAPFVCLDEIGIAEPETRRRAFALLGGRRSVLVEDDRIELACTVMATWNPTSGITVPDGAYRRALVLNVGADGVAIKDLATRLGRSERDRLGAASLEPGLLALGPRELSEDAEGILEKLRKPLTAEGDKRLDRRLLVQATVGRAARLGLGSGDDLRAVAYWVGFDALCVTETVAGLVNPWHFDADRLAASMAGAPGCEELVAAARRRITSCRRIADDLAAMRKDRQVEDLELTGDRAAFVESIKVTTATIARVPPQHKPQAAGLQAQLRKLSERAGDARSRAGLDELREQATPVIEQAHRLRSEIDRQERATADRAALRRSHEQAAKRQQRERATADKRRRAREARLVALRRRTTTKPREAVARQLASLGALEPTEITITEYPEPEPAAVFGSLVAWAINGADIRDACRPVTRNVRGYKDNAGRTWTPDQLREWGSPAVHAVIDAALAATTRPALRALGSPENPALARPRLYVDDAVGSGIAAMPTDY